MTAKQRAREDALITAVLSGYKGARRDALIPILQAMQDRLGYLSRDAVRRIADHLHLPAAKVFGVATFYNQFRFQPKGKFHIQVCRGTACHVRGSASTLDQVRRDLGIEPGECTRNREFSLEVVGCLGVCGLAPVMSVNNTMYGGMSPKKVRDLLESDRLTADKQ